MSFNVLALYPRPKCIPRKLASSLQRPRYAKYAKIQRFLSVCLRSQKKSIELKGRRIDRDNQSKRAAARTNYLLSIKTFLSM